jgi:hypothetical protein
MGMLYAFYKVGVTKSSILIIFVFWEGLFDYIDTDAIPGLLNSYKVGIVIYATLLILKKNTRFVTNKHDQLVNLTFILFSLSYWISYALNGGGILTILSQYLYKYAFLWIAYHYFKDIAYNIPKRKYFKNVLLTVLVVQIAVAFFKISLMGFSFEGLVGTISYGGGGPAVVIPIVGLIFYWVIKKGRFKKMDWCFVILILIISIASGKRQPIVIYPAILMALFIYVSKSVRLINLLKYSLIAVVVFYAGIRMTSTITPEKKVGGSFDISYISNYITEYYFGNTNKLGSIFDDDYRTSERGDGIILYIKPERLTLFNIKEICFGKGVYNIAVKKHGRFTSGSSRSNYGIQHDGLIGEAAALLYSIGYIGTISLILMVVSIIFSINNKKLGWVIFLYFLWDLLFYYNQMIFLNASGLFVLYIIFYSNSQKKEKMINSAVFTVSK